MTRAAEPDIHAIRRSVALIGRLSDGLVRVGPFHLGMDAALSWIPGVGEAYSAGAAAFLIVQGLRAGVPAPILVVAAAMMGGRTVISAVPIAGTAAADLLTAHRWSARLILAAIDRRIVAQGRAPAAARKRARAKAAPAGRDRTPLFAWPR
jgi:hypothetical protein